MMTKAESTGGSCPACRAKTGEPHRRNCRRLWPEKSRYRPASAPWLVDLVFPDTGEAEDSLDALNVFVDDTDTPEDPAKGR
jgi:hypothetical protein